MMDLTEHGIAPVAATDELLEQHQMAAWMALQDSQTYLGYLGEKIKDPELAKAIGLVTQAYEAFKKVSF